MNLNNKKSFSRMLQDFCNNTSLSGYKYTVERKRSLFERVLWIFLHLILMVVTIWLIVNLWISFMENPTVTTLKTTSYPVNKVPFPGVAICNLNKISLEKATNISKYLAKLSKKNPKTIFKKLLLLGSLYDFDSPETDDFLQFQSFLDEYEEISEIPLHPKYLLKELTDSCEEMIKLCKWGGKLVNCSDIFLMRRTHEGYCCTFNYIRPDNSFNQFQTEKPKKVLYQKSGYKQGLSIVVNNKPGDYSYSILESMGMKVQVFHSNDYPDIASGGLNEEIIEMGSETFLAIDPIVFESAAGVMTYPINKRQCYFRNEKLTVLGEYSESDCYVDCRVKSMLALCQCVPFMIPVGNNDTVCTLADVPCLNKYKDKWKALAPQDDVGDELSKELNDALYCKNRCYSSCDDTHYDITTNPTKLFLNPNHKFVTKNDSIIHVYFIKEYVHLYRQDVVYYWFEILSNFGGTFGLMIGLSIISIIEFIVFFTYKWIVYSYKN